MQRISFVRAFSWAVALTLALFPQTGSAKGFRVLHTFQGSTDGSFAVPGLTIGGDGSIYGTTAEGGNSGCFNFGCGTIFKIAPGGEYSILYRFTGVPDGAIPDWGVVADKSGNLYGTTSAGGGPGCQNNLGCGSIFKLSSENVETVLLAFSFAANPVSGLVRDKQGNLFGVLPVSGGTGCGGLGCGSVFELTSAGKLKILHDFQGGADGADPQGSLIRDDAGNLYGVTQFGGGGACAAGPNQGCGTVFKIDSHGNELVLYAFQAGKDGGAPMGPLIRDAAGNLYGTTEGGGAAAKCHCGTVFKVTPDGVETILHSFRGHKDGYKPISSLAMDAAGNLYGTTVEGGGSACGGGGCGTIFQISPDGSETVLHRFDGNDGAVPLGLIMDSHGNLFGTTAGGSTGFGEVFEQKTGTRKSIR